MDKITHLFLYTYFPPFTVAVKTNRVFHIWWQVSRRLCWGRIKLIECVCMIDYGVDIKSKLRFGAAKTDLAMAQLLQYNCYAANREGISNCRHLRDRETSFPVFIGMYVYYKTRKKGLVNMLHDHGLPNKRVLEISAQLGGAAVDWRRSSREIHRARSRLSFHTQKRNFHYCCHG